MCTLGCLGVGRLLPQPMSYSLVGGAYPTHHHTSCRDCISSLLLNCVRVNNLLYEL